MVGLGTTDSHHVAICCSAVAVLKCVAAQEIAVMLQCCCTAVAVLKCVAAQRIAVMLQCVAALLQC